MDPEWTEVACVLLSSSNGGQEDPAATPVRALAFDTAQELLWTGNSEGRVASFAGAELQNYVSYIIHPPSDGEVRHILLNDTGVISLGPRGVHMALRRGLPLWNCRHEAMTDLWCMSFTSNACTEVLVAGRQSTMLVIDLKEGEVIRQIKTEECYTMMKRNSRFICAATDHGTVDIIDPTTFEVLKSWNAHSALIHDMDVQADFLVTCGATLKQQGAVMFDPYVNLFDLKQMTSMAPIPFPPCAAFVRMHPRMVTTAIVASTSGQIHIIDLMSPNTSSVKQANIASYLARIEISPTGEALVLADNDCFMHLWGSPSRIQFTEYPVLIETETNIEEDQHKETEWEAWSDDENDETLPLNSVGVPYYRETLLSAFPHLVVDVGAPPARYELNLTENKTAFEYGWYTPNNGSTLPNQVEDTRKDENKGAGKAIQTPKFLSERSRDLVSATSGGALGGGKKGAYESGAGGSGSNGDAANGADDVNSAAALASSELASLGPEAPGMYRAVEIKFSKFGVDDFDFGYYNRSRYAGLENHFANSYANALLQLLRFTPSICNLALQHAASACLDDQCLLCELGYLCDMLHKAEGATCQATNMLKTLSGLPQAHQLRLIEEENPNTPITEMLQNLTRFLLTQIAGDFKRMLPDSNAMEDVLATSGVTYMRCMHCRSETKRAVSTYVNNLKYPSPQRTHAGRGGGIGAGGMGGPGLGAGLGAANASMPKQPKITFSQVLKSSVEQDSSTKGWCEVCQRYQTLQNRKTITSIPSVLTLNASGPQNLNYPEFRRLWGTPGWLPEEIGIIVDPAGQFFCYEGEDLKLHLQRGIHDIKVYSLIGMATNVDNGGQPAKSHLVAMVNVGYSEPTATEQPEWHLFNDFLVRQTSPGEALSFNTHWKTPSVVLFQLKSYNNKIDTEWKSRIDTSVLYMDCGKNTGHETYTPLEPSKERPGPDTIVALDTEFVALKQPEIEMNSEGEMETIRPMTHALARVSVVRGQGMEEGLPFIDDYIIIKEAVVDYLTLYSGITRNDLDPRTSQHTLVPLKLAYKKLWVLLNLGCKFLGHGLKQDFRVINIQVPKAQIIDTIDLFFLKARLRKLSLAFLAWCVLKENIQLETHDSIEDARTALKLYRKFLEYDDAGILEMQLQEIYREGRDCNFKAPKKALNGNGNGHGAVVAASGTDTPVGAPSGTSVSPLQVRSQPAPPSITAAATAAAIAAASIPATVAATIPPAPNTVPAPGSAPVPTALHGLTPGQAQPPPTAVVNQGQAQAQLPVPGPMGSIPRPQQPPPGFGPLHGTAMNNIHMGQNNHNNHQHVHGGPPPHHHHHHQPPPPSSHRSPMSNGGGGRYQPPQQMPYRLNHNSHGGHPAHQAHANHTTHQGHTSHTGHNHQGHQGHTNGGHNPHYRQYRRG
ncbi:pab-dependent poly -specific ribonuclease subunit pan2 [Ophiostoma piceae UAMH 11346]|uniref:PAN2-PAN3 deadenylation complex catalytic subunit PAN2 n=1 Tax=Ophiostoma piceae (strain UAMH 11346) TaxID=1262450 RepID=S3BWK7_OPHP1|nr:pab-dependent poly -specific ribonuclease subunit pan2 [Ophiostoma piceae UAMH 11346]